MIDDQIRTVVRSTVGRTASSACFCQAAEIMSTSTFISGCAAAALCKSPSGTGGGGRRTMEKVVYTSLRINEAGGGFGVREGEAE